MNKSIKRICNVDIKLYNRDKDILNKNGIYVYFPDDDISNCKAMIIGPSDTPYAHGCLFFDIKFSSLYPFEPPKVQYISNSSIRIHPNLYVNGKVCLSILGTWAGPGWCSTMNVISLLVTIQSLLTANPIEHEPHYEKETGIISKNYISLIEYETIRSLIIKRYTHLHTRPDLYEFKKEMIKNILLNSESILHNIERLIKYDKYKLYSKIYSCNIYIDWVKINKSYRDMLQDITTLNNELNILDDNTESVAETNCKIVSSPHPTIPIQSSNTNPVPKQKYTRKCPNKPSKYYDINHIMISENDGKQYIVKQYTMKNGKVQKKWVKV